MYRKIRTGFREALRFVPPLSAAVSWVRSASEFEWDIHLMSGNDFKKDLRGGQIPAPDSVRSELLREPLPKYVWRCSLRASSAPVVEMILDTTAMLNGYQVQRLWWNDEAVKEGVQNILSNASLYPRALQILGSRLLATIKNS